MKKKTQTYKKHLPMYLMFLPVGILLFFLNYLPMLGISLAFTEYTPYKGPNFVGLENFKTLFSNARFASAFKNTLVLSLSNIILGLVIAVLIALLLNELRSIRFKKTVQTLIFLPHFMSWVVVASIFTIVLSPQSGAVNALMKQFGVSPIYFLGDKRWWTPIYLFITRWKETGYSVVIFMAALTSISPDLYEAAMIDGANRFQSLINITVPGILTTIMVVFILNLAKVMTLFESVFVLQNDMVLSQAEVIATYVYKVGLKQADYGYSTAVGLFNSVISLILVVGGNYASKKITNNNLL